MFTADHLVNELNQLGVHYLIGSDGEPGLFDRLTPAELFAGLASQNDARLRSAIIAVLLQFPEFAEQATDALELLNYPHRTTFQLYYTAAHFLQLAYFDHLKQLLGPSEELPDHFSKELNIYQEDWSSTDPLKNLARRHREISGLAINWYGTYHHAAQRVITRLKKEKEWATV